MNKYKQKKRAVINFSVKGLSVDVTTFLYKKQRIRECSKWIQKAIKFTLWYERYPKGFLISLIENNFELCKHILRKIGSSRELNRESVKY